MKKSSMRILCLAFTLVLALAFAIPLDAVDRGVKSDTLEVYIDGQLAKTYAVSDMQALTTAASTEVSYGCIDSMPTSVYARVTGVYLSDLYDDLHLDETSVASLQFTATDGYAKTYSSDLLKRTGYYYPGLFATGAIDAETGKVANVATATANAVAVEPMLAYDIYFGRVSGVEDPSKAADYSAQMTDSDRFRLCFGLTEQDLTSGNSTSSNFARWIKRLDITTAHPAILDVYVNGELKKAYTKADLNALVTAASSHVNYCAIDRMPAKVYGVGTGVFLQDLAADLEINTNDVASVKLTAADEFSTTMTGAEVFDTRYYYSNLFVRGNLDADTGKVTNVDEVKEGAVPVKPMLAMASYSGRSEGNDNPAGAHQNDMSEEKSLQFFRGMTADDLTSGKPSSGAFISNMVRVDLEVESAASMYFDDMDDYIWAVEAVDFLYSNGTVKGTSETEYSPANPILRGDFILMLYRAFNLTATVDGNFADVSTDDYYYDAIAVAKALGIGKGDGANFHPTANLTREDGIVLVYRTLELQGISVPASGDLSAFGDAGQVSDYASDAMKAFVGAGIVIGSDGKLNPGSSLTRAEMGVILYRVMTALAS